MNYQDYSTEDFVLDKNFRAWVAQPDKESNLHWHRFLEQHPEKIKEVKKAKAILQKMGFRHYLLSAEEVKTLWDAIQQKKEVPIAPQQREVVPLNPVFVAEHHQRLRPWYRVYPKQQAFRVAASLTALILVASLCWWWAVYSHEQVYTTAYGETSTVRLPDGSVAILNAHSTLRVPESWQGAPAREVWLEGEAFFQVAKTRQEDHLTRQMPYPFIVHSQEVAIEVLGTEFNVNTRREKVQVVLNSGKVNVKWHEQEVMMAPGELVEVNREKDMLLQKVVQPKLYSSWKDHRLLCDGTPLGELAKVIEDRFGYEVVLSEKSLSDIRVSGTIPMDDIETFNLVLSKLIQGQVEKQGDKVFISQ